MSRMDKLIAAHCPDGVPHVQLHSVAEYSGSRIDATEVSPANFVGVDNLLPDKRGRTDATYFPNTARLTAFKEGDVLLGNIRPYLKKVWLADRSGGCSGDVLAIRINTEFRDRLAPEFLYYLLSSDAFFTYNMQHAKGAKMPRGSKPAILRYVVPVPPLEVQHEIVRILDKFTALEAELEAELEARQKQYAHYRTLLINSFDNKAKRQALGDIAQLTIGTFVKKTLQSDSYEFPVYNGGVQPTGYYTQYNAPADSIVIAARGSIGFTNYVKTNFWAGNSSYVIRELELNVHDRYLYHYLKHHEKGLLKLRSTGSIPALNKRPLEKFLVALPPIAQQYEVANTLDALDLLVNDLRFGLPAEIAARRKQYEHYRDQLLTFKELAS